MLDFNKAAFDNSVNAMNMLQEQAEKNFNTFLEQAAWIPEEGKKAVSDWMKAYKKGCEDFRKAVDENYKKVQEFFDSMS
jgi:polyhydroxyalkanoate synthesis regulator phasin